MERPQENNPAAVGVRDFKCRFCDRHFSSYQALGGHTAGHTTKSGESSNAGKPHRCTVCGELFSSGQALGGHMRKHRPLQPATTSDIADVANPDEGLMMEKKKKKKIEFDLNIAVPALEEEDCSLSLRINDQDLTPNLDLGLGLRLK